MGDYYLADNAFDPYYRQTVSHLLSGSVSVQLSHMVSQGVCLWGH